MGDHPRLTAKCRTTGNEPAGVPRKGKRRKDRDRDGSERNVYCREEARDR